MNKLGKRRKNFFPTFLVALIFWTAWGFTVFRITPDNPLAFLLFYLTLFVALFLTMALLLGHTRRGFLTTLVVIGFLILRQIKLASIFNSVLLVSFFLSLELYLSKGKTN